jgi:secreted PhoX family phosphatase
MAFDPQGNLWVADAGNNRVLRFNASVIGAGATNGPAADIVLGQTDFVTSTYNNPTNDITTLTAINEPTGIVFDNEGRLYVAESATGVRGRILIYNGAFSTGAPASRLIGVVPSSAISF